LLVETTVGALLLLPIVAMGAGDLLVLSTVSTEVIEVDA
jgi:hypothetical protein